MFRVGLGVQGARRTQEHGRAARPALCAVPGQPRAGAPAPAHDVRQPVAAAHQRDGHQAHLRPAGTGAPLSRPGSHSLQLKPATPSAPGTRARKRAWPRRARGRSTAGPAATPSCARSQLCGGTDGEAEVACERLLVLASASRGGAQARRRGAPVAAPAHRLHRALILHGAKAERQQPAGATGLPFSTA